MDVLKEERIKVVKHLQKLEITGLGGGGTSGNISIKNNGNDLIAISPSGVSYDSLNWEMIPVIDRNGKIISGSNRPSSEFLFHLKAYDIREDINSVVHTHSINAAAFSTLGVDLPPLHYIIGYAGDKVPFVPYEVFGGADLASLIGDKIKNYNGVILGNHGVVAVGESIDTAYSCAEAIEFVSEIYLKTNNMQLKPKVLSNEQMNVVLEKFKTYGQGKS